MTWPFDARFQEQVLTRARILQILLPREHGTGGQKKWVCVTNPSLTTEDTQLVEENDRNYGD